MADVTGALHHQFGGKTYTLRLTPRGIAKLQAEHGVNLGGILSGVAQAIPPFAVLLGVVTEALKKGEGLPDGKAEDLADDMMADDISLASRVLAASFPSAEGNVKGAKRAKT